MEDNTLNLATVENTDLRLLRVDLPSVTKFVNKDRLYLTLLGVIYDEVLQGNHGSIKGNPLMHYNCFSIGRGDDLYLYYKQCVMMLLENIIRPVCKEIVTNITSKNVNIANREAKTHTDHAKIDKELQLLAFSDNITYESSNGYLENLVQRLYYGELIEKAKRIKKDKLDKHIMSIAAAAATYQILQKRFNEGYDLKEYCIGEKKLKTNADILSSSNYNYEAVKHILYKEYKDNPIVKQGSVNPTYICSYFSKKSNKDQINMKESKDHVFRKLNKMANNFLTKEPQFINIKGNMLADKHPSMIYLDFANLSHQQKTMIIDRVLKDEVLVKKIQQKYSQKVNSSATVVDSKEDNDIVFDVTNVVEYESPQSAVPETKIVEDNLLHMSRTDIFTELTNQFLLWFGFNLKNINGQPNSYSQLEQFFFSEITKRKNNFLYKIMMARYSNDSSFITPLLTLGSVVFQWDYPDKDFNWDRVYQSIHKKIIDLKSIDLPDLNQPDLRLKTDIVLNSEQVLDWAVKKCNQISYMFYIITNIEQAVLTEDNIKTIISLFYNCDSVNVWTTMNEACEKSMKFLASDDITNKYKKDIKTLSVKGLSLIDGNDRDINKRQIANLQKQLRGAEDNAIEKFEIASKYIYGLMWGMILHFSYTEKSISKSAMELMKNADRISPLSTEKRYSENILVSSIIESLFYIIETLDIILQKIYNVDFKKIKMPTNMNPGYRNRISYILKPTVSILIGRQRTVRTETSGSLRHFSNLVCYNCKKLKSKGKTKIPRIGKSVSQKDCVLCNKLTDTVKDKASRAKIPQTNMNLVSTVELEDMIRNTYNQSSKSINRVIIEETKDDMLSDKIESKQWLFSWGNDFSPNRTAIIEFARIMGDKPSRIIKSSLFSALKLVLQSHLTEKRLLNRLTFFKPVDLGNIDDDDDILFEI